MGVNLKRTHCCDCEGRYTSYVDWVLETTSTSVMIYHRGASVSEQHTDSLRTKQDLSHTSGYDDESSLEIAARHSIHMPTARTATLSVATYA